MNNVILLQHIGRFCLDKKKSNINLISLRKKIVLDFDIKRLNFVSPRLCYWGLPWTRSRATNLLSLLLKTRQFVLRGHFSGRHTTMNSSHRHPGEIKYPIKKTPLHFNIEKSHVTSVVETCTSVLIARLNINQ